MRPSLLLVVASLTLAAQASWFSGSSSEPAYSSWNTNELKAWLEVHNVPVPDHVVSHAELKSLVEDNWNTASAWTYDQYTSAQQAFSDLRETAFDTWDESRLREFLLQHGIVAPKGPREHLVLLAKQKYRSYNNAASSFAFQASATASTAVYGDSAHQMSKSAYSVASQATAAASGAASQASVAAAQTSADVARKFDESKDYVYSTWSENQMRTYLEEKGLLKTKTQKRKDELLAMMHNAYGSVADPIWQAWSDSYMHGWLVSHGIIKTDFEKNRDKLTKLMNNYYYSTTDTVYSSWSDSQLKQWLVDHNVVKSDAQVTRDKMISMVQDNYVSAKNTFWDAWSDNSIRDWLIENGYMRSDAQYKRDQLIKLAENKYTDTQAKTAAYLTWPDARLRAFLRERGVGEDFVPTSRPGLLQETRIRWVQSQTRAESLFAKIKEVVNSGYFKAEDVLMHIVSLLSGGWEETKHSGEKAEGWADEKVTQARKSTGEKVKIVGQKMEGEL